MTPRQMRHGIDVLSDLLSFFEASPPFISVATVKLRDHHGPGFKLSTVNAILSLRTDLTKEGRDEARKICKDVLENYQEGKNEKKNKANHIQMFDELEENTGGDESSTP